MDYTKEETAFVEFCANNIDCRRRAACPLVESCEEGKKICLEIPSKMTHGEELSPEDKEIICYFLETKLWVKNKCTPKGTDAECPNVKLCDDREKEHREIICQELINKLGCYSPEDYQVLEQEIQKIIINNLDKLNWDVGEELLYYAEHPRIPTGEPDILLKGKESETLYVVELKPASGTRENVGQLQSYVGWYKKNMPAQFKAVKGILLAKEMDDGARYAIEANPDLQARLFELYVEIKKVE